MNEELQNDSNVEQGSEEDFSFYGEGTDDSQVQDIQGITDVVTDYVYTNLNYPCLIIKSGFQCPQHKLTVLSNMVKSIRDDKDISLYFEDGNELYKMGMLSGVQIEAFLVIVGEENVIGFFDASKKLTGDLLYVLCS